MKLPFLHEAKKDDQKFDLSALELFEYRETLDPSAPSFVLRVNDRNNYLRDDLRLKKGSEIAITMGTGQASTGVDEYKFTVLETQFKDDTLHVVGFDSRLYALKQPALTASFYSDLQPPQVIEKLMNDSVTALGNFPTILPYHLLPNCTPSKLIRLIMRENGGVFYIDRRGAFFAAYSELKSAKSEFTYSFNTFNEPLQINSYRLLEKLGRYERLQRKNYSGWSMDQGVLLAGVDSSTVEVAVDNENILKNMNKQMVDVLEMEILGDDRLFVGMKLTIEVIRPHLVDRELDESLPPEMIITRINHVQERSKYIMYVTLGVIVE